MGVKWRDFQMPKRLDCDESTYTATYGKFIAEPFERGYGVTLGNSLRRILLSSIEGSAITSIKIDGVQHEFSTIPGVMEPVCDIILNIKNLVLRSHSKTLKTVYIKAHSKGEVKAKDIIADETIEVLNPDLHIAMLTRDTQFNVELEVARGRGYVPADLNKKDTNPVGTIPTCATGGVRGPICRRARSPTGWSRPQHTREKSESCRRCSRPARRFPRRSI